jgi:hypothetical protein
VANRSTLFGASPSFQSCVTETESMATVCPSSHSPTSGGHLHAFDKRCAQHQREEGCVWRAPCIGMCISGQGWVGEGWRWGWVGG